MPGPSIRSVSKLVVRSTIIIVLLLLPCSPLFAEWHKDYEAAMELIDKGQSGAAISKLQAAIRQKNDEGANIKFYGMKFGDYFPHFYLGMAYFGQKNYESALREFEISEKQGAILRKQNLYERLNGTKTLAKAQQIVKDNPQIAQNPQVDIPIVKPPQEEKKPPEEEKKPVDVAQVQPQEKPPVEELKTKPQPEEKKPEQKKPEEKIAKVDPQLKPPPPIDPTTVDPNSDVRNKMLRNGARKYFEGDYDSAILYLVEVQKLSHDDASADFLLGCSYASKYLLSGAQNKHYLERAALLFRKVKKTNPKYQPRNSSYLSPAVLEIYQKTT